MQYEIIGGELPVLLCKLQAGETMITESGSMSWMDDGIEMETTTGGGLGKAFGRMFAGENMFQNRYTARREGEIAFASSFVGTILPIMIEPGKEIICQKSAFLAAEEGVDLSVHFQKKLGAGFFGGEGFIMQRLSGRGMAFIEIDGYAQEYNLANGERKIISTGFLAMMDSTCSMDIQTVKGAKNMLFGGEGFFNTVITGPGRIVIQSMPISQVAASLSRFFPSSSS
ncbi:MAG: TIGR00266 family protein [Tissierellia bacterium]|nr:TIGR00266 family protein [Tissierellia bacterium]